MKLQCKRCGRIYEGKSRNRRYCEDCLHRAAVERSAERAGPDGNAALAAARLRLGLTLKDMAVYLDVPYAAYYRAEHDGGEPGAAFRRKAEEKLGVPADELFGKLEYVRLCRSCGAAYKTGSVRSRICPACEEARRTPQAIKPRKRDCRGIAEIARAARAAGMSYGRYVSKQEGTGWIEER